MIVVVTGGDGFIGRNLRQHLAERRDIEVRSLTRALPRKDWPDLLAGADVVVHLAGVNRPTQVEEFASGNVELTRALTGTIRQAVHAGARRPCVVYASSIQADLDNPYGNSKREAERLLLALHDEGACVARIFRLPNVFGKWARPDYNSVVATFCHNVARGLPIHVYDSSASLTLLHVDDVVRSLIEVIDGHCGEPVFGSVEPRYETTVGELAELIRGFSASRETLLTERVGSGLVRALYATYVSYLPPEQFAYGVPRHRDARGDFVEMLKTRDSGQFSYFTAHPGATRGGHYHHSKTEKFLVIRGQARFRFRHVQTGERHELLATGDSPAIVETVPGWTHDITNVGADELVVMIWANEVYDRSRPDTYACPV